MVLEGWVGDWRGGGDTILIFGAVGDEYCLSRLWLRSRRMMGLSLNR